MIVVRGARIMRLDAAGNPVGPSIAVEGLATIAFEATEIAQSFDRLTSATRTVSIRLSKVAPAMFDLLGLPDQARRQRRRLRHARTIRAVARRRNKHGRVGVRR